MNWLYKKVMEFLIGKALASSDRVKVTVAGFVSAALLKVLAGCGVCAAVLTPDLVNQLSLGIAGAVVTLVASITHRDVAAPGELVDGAAVPVEHIDTRALRGGDRP